MLTVGDIWTCVGESYESRKKIWTA